MINLLKSDSQISLVESASDSDEALLKIVNYTPDLILLEYPVMGKTGNELIGFIKTRFTDATLVFVSKNKDYAAEAIRHEAFNFILKPVSGKKLEKIIEKVLIAKRSNIQTRINQVIIAKTPEETKFRFQTPRGYVFVDPDEIIYCRANGYYSEFILTGDRMLSCMITLAKLETLLRQFDFLRVSRSNLINPKYLRKIYRESNSVVLLAQGKEYEVKGSKPILRNLINSDNE
jgi:DNA-binding LytR/AlgR family response regulator